MKKLKSVMVIIGQMGHHVVSSSGSVVFSVAFEPRDTCKPVASA
jgi:hypothetical protein